MSDDLLILEINDAGIETYRASGPAAPPSPGYALVDDVGIMVGRTAFDNARRRPRSVNHRFWSELDTEPLPRPFPGELSTADLAHAHLEQIWAAVGEGADRVILAVPGTETEQRLGLLLGIARACEIPVVGMVDAALAAAMGVSGRRLLHLDVQLHRVVVTELEQDRELVRGAVHALPGAGLAALQDAWARSIASLFVKKTRFDPLHGADSEQGLYTKLPDLLLRLRDQEAAEVEIAAQERTHTLSVGRRELVASVECEYDSIVHLLRRQGGDESTVLVSSRALLPGLLDLLRKSGLPRVEALSAGAAAAGARCHAGAICASGESLPFITRLPLRAPQSRVSAPATPGTPSHVLHQGLAHPLAEGTFLVGSAVPLGHAGLRLDAAPAEACRLVRRGGRVILESLDGSCTVNGAAVDGPMEVAAGDRIDVADTQLLLIRTLEPVETDAPTPD